MVPWIFLAVSVWGALFTYNAHRPVERWPLVGPSFFAAWLTSELALHHLFWQALATWALVRWGALAHTAGLVGLAVTGVSWVGLAGIQLSALRDERIILSALKETLGDDFRDRLDRRVAKRLDFWRVIMPFWMRRSTVQRLRDIPYVEDGARRHRLDIYRPRGVTTSAPVVLQIHGGAWVIGNKDQQGLPMVHHLAEMGFLAVTINYALSPKATWPEHLIDCKRALKWIRENVAEYGGDPRFVIVTGGSAGGHLAAMMALTANDPSLQPGFEEVDTSVDGFVPFYGVFDWTNRFGFRREPNTLRALLETRVVKQKQREAGEIFDRASPMSRISGDIPPAMIIHGKKDNLAPVAEAERFVMLLRERSREPVVYAELPGAHHAFEVFHSVRTLHAIHGVEQFAAWVHATRAERRRRAQGA